MTKFTLVIDLGNDAMQTRENIADALITVSGKVREGVETWQDHSTIKDANGNTVGYWELTY